MNEHRENILRKLMHSPNMSFNELWERQGESNKFAYHLKVLVEDGLVCKKEEVYSLTHEGRKFVTYVDGDSGKKSKPPLSCVTLVIYDEKENKFLMTKRTKELFYGYWGVICGKIKFNQYILEAAACELKEESGLECDLELKGLCSYKTYNNGELSYSHQMFVVFGKNPRGELIKKTREGENCWLTESEVLKLKRFPSALTPIEIAKSKGFRWIEMDRFQENDEFIDKKLLRDVSF